MGTSQSYKIKSTPNWAKTKRAMTHLAAPGNMNDTNVNRFLGNFSRAVSEERVFGGAGGSSIGNFLDFIANIRDLGWEQAIQTIDPDIDVTQLSLEAFLEFLLELCCNNDSNLDDQAANVAFQEMEAYKIVGKRFFNADVLHWIAKDYDLVNLEGWGRNVPSIVSYFVNNRFYYRHVSFKSTMDWYNKHLKNKEQNARTVLRNIRSCLRRIFKIGNNEF